ncbi:MAG: hypothetical protein K1X44_06575, partial [Alphaproteobacteria bacterium]|nr:hypothetical protein [Alphaproteobacteria bacterium]
LSAEGKVFDKSGITNGINTGNPAYNPMNKSGDRSGDKNVGGFHPTATTQPTGVMLDGGMGDDTLTGSDGDDWLIGNSGKDTLKGGSGNDRLFIDADDSIIDGGDGYDVAVINDDRGVNLDVAAGHIEAVQGDNGNDVLDASGYKAGDKSVNNTGINVTRIKKIILKIRNVANDDKRKHTAEGHRYAA